jgi:hypothetical protein
MVATVVPVSEMENESGVNMLPPISANIPENEKTTPPANETASFFDPATLSDYNEACENGVLYHAGIQGSKNGGNIHLSLPASIFGWAMFTIVSMRGLQRSSMKGQNIQQCMLIVAYFIFVTIAPLVFIILATVMFQLYLLRALGEVALDKKTTVVSNPSRRAHTPR